MTPVSSFAWYKYAVSTGITPPLQIEPPSGREPEKRMLGTSVFQAAHPPRSRGAVTVFSFWSRVCCTNQPAAGEAIPASGVALGRPVSVRRCWGYVVWVAAGGMRGPLVELGGSDTFIE